MSFVACEIALSKGCWSRYPSSARVRRELQRVFEDSLLAVTFRDPGNDNAIEADVGVDGWETCERICDIIFGAFLRWKPEYESMIEVEILRAPEGPFDDPFEYVQDEFDGWDEFDGVQRVWH